MLKYYLIEEYRRHLSIARKYSFFIFPLYVIFFTFFGGIFINDVLEIFPYRTFIKIVMISIFIYGFGVGSFEFLGRSFEKFKLVNTSSILPVSNKRNYFYAFMRDAIYYTILFLIPTFAGLCLAMPFSSLKISQISFFTLSILLSMFIGYSSSYFSFSLYFRRKFFYYIFIISILAYLLLSFIFPIFPTAEFQIKKDLVLLLYSVIAVIILVILGYFLTPEEFYEKIKIYKGRLWEYKKIFKDIIFAKDMEDVIRGQIIFKSILTYFFPMIILFIFVKILNLASSKNIYNPLSLSIMLSIFSTVVYSWLTIMDDYGYFSLLPVQGWDLILAHIKAHISIVSIISIPIIIFINLGALIYLIPSFLLFYLNCIYLLSVTAYLAGYRVTSLLFDPEIIMKFSIYSVVPGIVLMISSIGESFFSLISLFITSLFMIILTVFNFKNAKKKWIYF